MIKKLFKEYKINNNYNVNKTNKGNDKNNDDDGKKFQDLILCYLILLLLKYCRDTYRNTVTSRDSVVRSPVKEH